MATGLEITTDTGIIQIDENYPCLQLKYIGSATATIRHPASSNVNTNLLNYVDITVDAKTPIMALYGTNTYGVIAVRKNSATNWTFRVVAKFNTSIGNPPFTYLIFDSPTVSASGQGIELFSPTGDLLFSSASRIFSIIGVIPQNTQTISLPDNRKYAVCFNAYITVYELSVIEGGGGVAYPTGDLGAYGSNGTALIIDVTELV
jgi:hypothetical protein